MSFFSNNEFGESIFNRRYTQVPGETWEQAQYRQAMHVGEHESAEIREAFYEQLVEGRFAGGGRIAYSAGRPLAQMINCFVLPSIDSREGWGKTLSDSTIVSGTGGGIGTNFSNVRGRGEAIRGTGGVSSGSVSLMRAVNAVGNEIRGGGGRRAAYMFCLNHDHPDILEFVDSKLQSSAIPAHLLEKLLDNGVEYKDIPEHLLRGDLNCANISVVFMNESPEAFFHKVKNDLPHNLMFNGKVVKSISARELWQKMVHNALKNGEPGILNGHYANEMNNLWYCRQLVSTNPCGEIWMQPYSVCCLGALVLPRFVDMENKSFDWAGLKASTHLLVRFLDDVLDTTHYPIHEVTEESRLTRRIGAGYMGIHDALLMLGLRYSSEAGRGFARTIAEFVKIESYNASIDLAIEKGSFELFDQRFCDSKFVKTLPIGLQERISAHGIRNCAINTIAPYGTTAIVQGVTSGFEPMFAPAYDRTFVDGANGLRTETVVHPLFKMFVENGWDTSHFEAASDLSAEDHIKMQLLFQENIDNSVSKTININPGVIGEQELSDLFMTHLPHIKGITIYPEESRANTPLKRISNEAGMEFIRQNSSVKAEIIDDCVSGVCAV